MSRARRAKTRSPSRAAAPRAATEAGALIAAAALAGALAGACLIVDTGAEAAFDAPKRLVTLLGIVVAAVGLLAAARPRWSWSRVTAEQRIALALVSIALAIAAVAAVVSPRRTIALDATRTLLLFSALLPLGASRALDEGRARILAGVLVGACSVNAVASLLQFTGALRLFTVETVGGRLDVAAFVGNDGVLSLALALSGLLCLALGLATRSPAFRVIAAVGLVLHLAALAVNQSLTALTALAAGSLVLVTLALGRRARLVTGAAVLVIAAGLAFQPALSARARHAIARVRAGDWDLALTYRLGPWAAAVEMARARPLVGWGPGTFGAEFVPHRLSAELRVHRRFVNPFLAGSYTEAHSEYLQAAAEAGIPAALAAVAAAGTVIVGLLRAIRRSADGPSRRDAIVVLALLGAGTTAALTWFPLQRPITAVPLLLAAGRAWRLLGLEHPEATS